MYLLVLLTYMSIILKVTVADLNDKLNGDEEENYQENDEEIIQNVFTDNNEDKRRPFQKLQHYCT